MDLVSRLRPNKFALDKEFEDQAGLFNTASAIMVEKEEEYNLHQQYIDVRSSEISYLIRKGEFEDYDLTKTTESSITDFLGQYKELVELKKEGARLKKEWVEAKQLVESFRHKKSAIEYLTTLKLNGDYSEPNISSEDQQKVVAIEEANVTNENVERRRSNRRNNRKGDK